MVPPNLLRRGKRCSRVRRRNEVDRELRHIILGGAGFLQHGDHVAQCLCGLSSDVISDDISFSVDSVLATHHEKGTTLDQYALAEARDSGRAILG